jgi:hypothetical protein
MLSPAGDFPELDALQFLPARRLMVVHAGR